VQRSANLPNFSSSRNRYNFFIYVIDIRISHELVRANDMQKRAFCDFDLFVAESGGWRSWAGQSVGESNESHLETAERVYCTSSFLSGGKQTAEKLGSWYAVGGRQDSGAEALPDFVGFMRGLKPPPPSEISLK
jgi:hypothetical protein